jgi:lipid-binding SYLF domain-containing protein
LGRSENCSDGHQALALLPIAINFNQEAHVMTKSTMRKPSIHEEVIGTLEHLEAEDPGLKQVLKKAYGYAIFPSVGKAALVLGGAYGRGEVYERGKLIGYATIAQTTIGVQIGGDTFSEVIAFESKQSLDRFKNGRFAFAANASAVLIKAGAGGSANYEKGVKVFAYAEGGMLLEAAIGGQRFKFKPMDEQASQENKKDSRGRAENQGTGQEEEQEESDPTDDSAGGLRQVVSRVKEFATDHPVLATAIGVGAAGGVAWLVAQALRTSSDTSKGASESEGPNGSQGEEGDEGEARAEADSGSEQGQDEQSDDQGEDEDRDEDEESDDEGAQDSGAEEEDEDESDDQEQEEAAPSRGRRRARS